MQGYVINRLGQWDGRLGIRSLKDMIVKEAA
uniref:Uncharacterized protein n=1 Tax=Rhizophora mucronata TaxID=61149 RepID=A0A2P2QAJ1_RHIMU